jgi:hypothetical protein
VSVPNEYVSQREFDRYREGAATEHAQLRHDLDELEERYDNGLKAAVEGRRASVGLRIAGIGAGAGVLAACAAVITLWHSSGR